VADRPPTSARRSPLDLSFAGWFLLFAGTWELLFNRLASSIGLYAGVGAVGSWLSWLADSGRLAMNVVGILALVLLCVGLPRLANTQRFAPLPWRVLLMLSSPLYLPVICVAVFRPVSPWLVLAGYLATVISALLVAVLAAARDVGWAGRRVVVALALVQLLPALELTARVAEWFEPGGSLEILPPRFYLYGEVLMVITPVFCFFAFNHGRLRQLLRRPHLPALLLALATVGVGLATALYTGGGDFLSLVAFRTLGITVSVKGGAVLYLISLFLGTLLIGTLILPTRRYPTDVRSKRVGLGLAFVWLTGIQPTNPYQFALMLFGFVMLARGMVGDDPPPQPLEDLLELEAELDRGDPR
jgi:hypothetical protein